MYNDVVPPLRRTASSESIVRTSGKTFLDLHKSFAYIRRQKGQDIAVSFSFLFFLLLYHVPVNLLLELSLAPSARSYLRLLSLCTLI